jgi:hypothetical protein
MPRRTPVQTDDQRHCCGGGDRGAMSVDERVILLESGFDARSRGVNGSRGRAASREARGKVADYDVRSGTSCACAERTPKLPNERSIETDSPTDLERPCAREPRLEQTVPSSVAPASRTKQEKQG